MPCLYKAGATRHICLGSANALDADAVLSAIAASTFLIDENGSDELCQFCLDLVLRNIYTITKGRCTGCT